MPPLQPSGVQHLVVLFGGCCFGDATFGGAPWLVQHLGVQLGGAPSDTGAAPPLHPLCTHFAPPITGAAPPDFGGAPLLHPPCTLKGVGLWNITDVLEF